jgi:RHS repeat-associated protein
MVNERDQHRIEEACTAGTLYWRGVGQDALLETDLTGAGQEEYIFFGGNRVARRDTNGGTIHYYFSDHLGSHTAIESGDGSTCEHDIDYFPYGAQQQDYCSGPAQNYKFTGKERDSESGLDNFGARYHAFAMGRFVTPDPLHVMKQKLIDPQQLNMYAYVRNNPIRFVDPKGMYNTDCKGSDITKCSANIQNFETNRRNDLQSKDPAVRAAAAAFGSFNDNNKVDLKFDANATVGNTQQKVKNGRATDRVSVTMPTMDGGVNQPAAGLIAHEGVHVQDVQSSIAGVPVTHFVSEMKAYMAQAGTLRDFIPVGVLAFSTFVDSGTSMTLMPPEDSAASDVDEDAIRQFLATDPRYGLFPGPLGNQGGPVGVQPQ